MSSEFENGLFRWVLIHNLDFVVRLHNGTQALLDEKADDSEFSEEPMVESTIEHYHAMISASALLLVLGFLEEMLYLFWRRHLPCQDLGNGSSIDRYKPLFAELGMDLGRLSCWQRLKDAMEVRNCILHANGRISLMKNPESVRACIARHSGGLWEHHDRVRINATFLQVCIGAVRDLRDELLRSEQRTGT